jgi:hypothetical protein
LLQAALNKERLVGKLERLNVPNRAEVQAMCIRYRGLVDQLRPYEQSEDGAFIPLHVSTAIHGMPFQSQVVF